MAVSELPLFAHWMDWVRWLLPTIEKFPKRMRFTLTQRIDNLALDIAEELVEAHYSWRKRERLRLINRKLERLRIRLRRSHDLQVLPHRQYEFAMRSLDEAGRMVGGWLNQQEACETHRPPLWAYRLLRQSAGRRPQRRAWQKNRLPVAAFYFHLETELLQLERELLSNSYRPRPYRSFWVHEPKRRRICAADIRDRVVYHAIIRVLEPYFEAYFIHDAYACRPGKGTHRAVRRAQAFSRCHRYVLQLDVRQFFASVDHAILKVLLARWFKDRRWLALLAPIIDHPIPDSVPGSGLPIGNLTSQYFATFYLGYLDHFVKDELGSKGMCAAWTTYCCLARTRPCCIAS